MGRGGTGGMTAVQAEAGTFVFVFVDSERDRDDEAMVLGEEGREEDDGSNIFATKLVSRRKEDEERL